MQQPPGHGLFIKGRTPWNKGTKGLMPKPPNWKGGKEAWPKCPDCDTTLRNLYAKHCRSCYAAHQKGPNHPRWKGGANHVIKRRATLAKASGSHTNNDWELLKASYNYMCLCCKQQEPFIKLSEDHIIPLSIGGSNDIENIQPLCISCNSRKHDRIINFKRHNVSFI